MKTMVLDIGGTAMKSALFENGTLEDIRETPTQAAAGGAHVVKRALSVISCYREQYSFDRIGISTAGQVNPQTGTIIYANQNIPGYTGTPLAALVQAEFGIPVFVENDVNAAALGEALFGAGQDEDDFACLTYGTGVGGALFLRGSLYHGSSFSAGEFGAIVTHPEDITPGCDPFTGCYERYASTTALVRSAMQLDPSLDNGRKIFERKEEPAVAAVIDRWIGEIVHGLATITHMLNPSCLILGGGVMEQPCVPKRIEEQLRSRLMTSFQHVKIKKAVLGNQAGMLGAAMLPASSGR